MEISVSKLAKRILAVAICIVFSSGAYAQNDTLQTQDEYIILNSVNLDEVLVKAQKPVVNVKTDKVVYQVANDEEAKTRTVLEMLRKVPMVTVDGRGNITVNGSSQFKVYVDGRLNTTITRNPTQMLRNMPASNIRNIEVLTNPGAQYDAEGAGGVLYITTKKGGAKQMMNLAEEEAESATQGTIHATAGTKTWGVDASLSAQKNRWSYDMNLNAEYMYSPNTIMESEAIDKDSRQWMSQKSTSKMPFTMGEFGVGCEIDSVRSLHANASVMWFGMNDSGTPYYNYCGGMWGGSAGSPTGQGMNFTGSQMMKMNEVGFDGSIDYQRSWGEKGRAFFNYQISHAPNRNDSENRYSGLDTSNPLIAEILRNNRSETREKSTSHTLMSDITIPLHENHLLNTGVKMTADRSESDARELEEVEGSFIEDASRSIHFRQHQYIAAAYAEWDARWGWFGMKNGLRYEHTWQDSRYLKGEGSDFKVNYGALVPSVSLTANANESNNFGLQYTMRIRRPRINELDPYINRADPTQLSYGNPHLDAQHLHNAAFVYTLSKSKLALRMSLNHSWSNDGITQYSKLIDGRINTTYGNLSKNRTTSLNGFISWGIFSTTRLTVSGEVGYSDMRSAEIEAHNYGWHGECNAGLQQELPWGIKWNTNVEWMSRRQTLQGYESGMTMLSTTLSRSFCKERLNVSLSGMTGLGHGGKMVWESVTKSKDFTNTSRYIDNMQDITLGISWTFGGAKTKHMDESMPMDFEESGNGGGKSMRMRHRR